MKKNALFIVCDELNNKTTVPFGNKIVPTINLLMNKFDVTITLKNSINFYKDLDFNKIKIFENNKNVNNDIKNFFRKENIYNIYIVGSNENGCIKKYSLKYSKLFKTFIIVDVIRFESDMKETLDYLSNRNVNIINSNDIDIFLKDRKCHVRHIK